MVHSSKGHRSLLTIWAACDRRGSLLSLLALDLERAESQIVGFTFPHPAASSHAPDPVHQIRLTTTNLSWPGCALIKIGSQGIYNYFAFLVALCKYLWLCEESSEYKLDLILVHKNILLELKLTWSIAWDKLFSTVLIFHHFGKIQKKFNGKPSWVTTRR